MNTRENPALGIFSESNIICENSLRERNQDVSCRFHKSLFLAGGTQGISRKDLYQPQFHPAQKALLPFNEEQGF
ncbi:hypothetical protein D3H55_17100 [Bacillus salacetis]|uniref:Uncharacterized protein n=1 Tax=Bacillus salacetis TaxID=2315464 RepID=A0A3A1QS99_9BACI|nr:hypothetical protein D3H55_17100 [Bacillus salacetis]